MIASEIFRSRRFWSAVIGMLVLLLSSVLPELEEHLNVIAPTVLIIIGLLIGGYSAVDVVEASKK